ncbi:MAG: TRAP transporter small permease subunit [Planctomycetota bacterium]
MPKLLDAIDAASVRIGQLAAWLGLGMVGAAVTVTLGAKVGALFGAPLRFVALDELQWYLFSATFLFAAPWALKEGAHVRVDVVQSRLGPRGRAWIDLIGGVVLLLPFALFAVYVTWPTAMESLRLREASPDAGGLARWPLKLAVPFAFGLLFLQGLSTTLRAGAVALGRAAADEATAGEAR